MKRIPINLDEKTHKILRAEKINISKRCRNFLKEIAINIEMMNPKIPETAIISQSYIKMPEQKPEKTKEEILNEWLKK